MTYIELMGLSFAMVRLDRNLDERISPLKRIARPATIRDLFKDIDLCRTMSTAVLVFESSQFCDL